MNISKKKEYIFHLLFGVVAVWGIYYLQEIYFPGSSRLEARGRRTFFLVIASAIYFSIFYTVKNYIKKKKK